MSRPLNLSLPADTRLTIIEVEPSPVATRRRVKVRCECGTVKWVALGSINGSTADTKSCGCLHREITERFATHGDSRVHYKARLYRIWSSMRQRTTNPKDARWAYYGARGITVVPEWNDYHAFKAWAITAGYQPGLSIDRIDRDGGYNPSNCRWVTRSENSRRAAVYRWEAERASVT